MLLKKHTYLLSAAVVLAISGQTPLKAETPTFLPSLAELQGQAGRFDEATEPGGKQLAAAPAGAQDIPIFVAPLPASSRPSAGADEVDIESLPTATTLPVAPLLPQQTQDPAPTQITPVGQSREPVAEKAEINEDAASVTPPKADTGGAAEIPVFVSPMTVTPAKDDNQTAKPQETLPSTEQQVTPPPMPEQKTTEKADGGEPDALVPATYRILAPVELSPDLPLVLVRFQDDLIHLSQEAALSGKPALVCEHAATLEQAAQEIATTPLFEVTTHFTSWQKALKPFVRQVENLQQHCNPKQAPADQLEPVLTAFKKLVEAR